MSRVIWVLGSGFSKPLGGPTLDELFTMRAYRELEAIYPSDGPLPQVRTRLLEGDCLLARRLFLVGCSRRDEIQFKATDGELHKVFGHLWRDAEEFLDVLETAGRGQDDSLSRLIGKMATSVEHSGAPFPQERVERVRDAARRILAVECSKFLLSARPASERWEPYRTWLRVLRNETLGHVHSIVTFNYDTALETLGLNDWVRLPDDASNDGPCILKLHGSVDWQRVGTSSFKISDNRHFAAECADSDLAIAPPGPEKVKIAEDFEPLWEAAEQRLRAAQVVFFIGYRFPPTDSTARRRILGSIPSKSSLNVVLGPDRGSPDVARLVGMLEFQSPDRTPKVHPMWAQDLLSVFPTGLLAT